MKKLYVWLILLIPAFVMGQSDHFSNKNAIKISPVEFGKAEFQISYERYFGDRSKSILISPSFILKENNFESKEGVQLEGQFRIYLSHVRSDEGDVFLGFHNIGLYTGVYARYLDYSEDYQYGWYDDMTGQHSSREFTKEVTATEGGAIIGLQIDITKRILIDFFVGGGIRYSDIVDSKDGVIGLEDYYDSYDVFDPEYKGVKPRLGLQLGVFF